LRPSDLHTRTMVPRIREQIAKRTGQGPAAAGILRALFVERRLPPRITQRLGTNRDLGLPLEYNDQPENRRRADEPRG